MDDMKKFFTNTMIRIAEKNSDLFLLGADLMKCDGSNVFQEKFPDRTINVGVAEANMLGIAAGLSARKKIPVAVSFACFASRRAFDQFFVSANYAKQNVKLLGSDPGVIAQLNGGTHMPFEDLGLMRTIPDIVVCDPCDGTSLSSLLEAQIERYGCSYMRIHRKEAKKIHAHDAAIKIGKGVELRKGTDVILIAAGVVMVPEALKAAEVLAGENISAGVVDMHTIKPLDEELILDYAATTGRIVTCENHQVTNGLGSAVSELLGEKRPTPMLRVGIKDRFGQVGKLDYLMETYGLTAENIVAAAKQLTG